MNSTIWLALAPVLVLEGLGSMLYLRTQKKTISAMTNLPDNILRRFGGELVVASVVVYYMLKKTIGRTENRLIEVIFECKKCCSSEKAMVESIFEQTVILENR